MKDVILALPGIKGDTADIAGFSWTLQEKLDRYFHWFTNLSALNNVFLPIVPTYMLFKSCYPNGLVPSEKQVGSLTRNQLGCT